MGLFSQIADTLPQAAMPTAPTFATPSPCPVCSSAAFYSDVYGGGPHCRGCGPPVAASLVLERLLVLWELDPLWEPDSDSPGQPPGRKWAWVKNPREE